jgi:hypothetical protein
MNPEPPTKGDNGEEQQAPPARPPGRHILREPLKDTRALRLRFVATAAGVLAVGAAVGLFLFLTQGSNQQAGQESPSQGVVCPYLQQAAVAYERGDSVAFNKTIERAVKIAEDTLQQSGETFGEPERIALELGLGPQEAAGKLLDKAESTCSQLGQWVPPNSGVPDAGSAGALAEGMRRPEGSCPTVGVPSADTLCQWTNARLA